MFHQYIIQSGNALVPWGYRDRNLFKDDVNRIARNVGCPTNNSEILINCLRKTNFQKLVNLTTYDVLDFPEILWIPTNEVESEDAFLTDNPQNLINKNKLRDYPFMIGAVYDEGLYITSRKFEILQVFLIIEEKRKTSFVFLIFLISIIIFGSLLCKFYLSVKKGCSGQMY